MGKFLGLVFIIIFNLMVGLYASEVTSTTSSDSVNLDHQSQAFDKNIIKAMNIVQTNIEWLEGLIGEMHRETLSFNIEKEFGELGVKAFNAYNVLLSLNKLRKVIGQEECIDNNEECSKNVIDTDNLLLEKFTKLKAKIQSNDPDQNEIFNLLFYINSLKVFGEEIVDKFIENCISNHWNNISRDSRSIINLVTNTNLNRIKDIAPYLGVEGVNTNNKEFLETGILNACGYYIKDLNLWYNLRNSIKNNHMEAAIIYAQYLLSNGKTELEELKQVRIARSKLDIDYIKELELKTSFIEENQENQVNDARTVLKLLERSFNNKQRAKILKETINVSEERLPPRNSYIKNGVLTTFFPLRESKIKSYHKFIKLKIKANDIEKMELTDGTNLYSSFSLSIIDEYKDFIFGADKIIAEAILLKIFMRGGYCLYLFPIIENKAYAKESIELFNRYKSDYQKKIKNMPSLSQLSRDLGLDNDMPQKSKKKNKKKKKNNVKNNQTKSAKAKATNSDSIAEMETTKTVSKPASIVKPQNRKILNKKSKQRSKLVKVNISDLNKAQVNREQDTTKNKSNTKTTSSPVKSSPKVVAKKLSLNSDIIEFFSDITKGNFRPFKNVKWSKVEGKIGKLVTFLSGIMKDSLHEYQYNDKGSIAKLTIDDFSFNLHASHGSDKTCYPPQIEYLRRGIVRSGIIEKLHKMGYEIDEEIISAQKELDEMYSPFK